MTVTIDNLADFVGTANTDPHLTGALDTALALVAQYVGDALIPDVINDRAVLMTGSELYHQRNSPQGLSQFGSLDGYAVRIARDPMVPAYPLLQQYVVGVA